MLLHPSKNPTVSKFYRKYLSLERLLLSLPSPSLWKGKSVVSFPLPSPYSSHVGVAVSFFNPREVKRCLVVWNNSQSPWQSRDWRQHPCITNLSLPPKRPWRLYQFLTEMGAVLSEMKTFSHKPIRVPVLQWFLPRTANLWCPPLRLWASQGWLPW